MSPRSHERRVQGWALAAVALPLAVGTFIALRPGVGRPLALSLLALAAGVAFALTVHLRRRVRHPLQTLANLLAALREGDFSFRGRAGGDDALGVAFQELNTLAELLQQQRVGTLEATALLRTVIEEIDVAIFAFDAEDRLRLVNPAGATLLGRSRERALDRPAPELGLGEALTGTDTLLELAFPGGAGRFELRRSTFRQGGRPHRLLVMSDLTRALREQEREAWQRLVRVLSHEINNSLAPIQSLAGSLDALTRKVPPPADLQADLQAGLAVIERRSAGLQRFLATYARLAKLPAPRLAPVDLQELLPRVARLETRCAVRCSPGPDLRVSADADQLEQALINLLRNAAEAGGESATVHLGWRREGRWACVEVLDEGPGLPPAANLFVPFFTTKPGGSGIGLALVRQIAEAHGGTIHLEGRGDRPGARALLRLPLPG